LLHQCTDIDPAGDQLASDAEREVALVARLGLPDRLAAIEERCVGPEGRKLFERFLRKVQKLEEQQVLQLRAKSDDEVGGG
jgi:hypothetical protein